MDHTHHYFFQNYFWALLALFKFSTEFGTLISQQFAPCMQIITLSKFRTFEQGIPIMS